jgi:hypothetical protein
MISRRGFLGSIAGAATSYFFFGSGIWRPNAQLITPPIVPPTIPPAGLVVDTNSSFAHIVRLLKIPEEYSDGEFYKVFVDGEKIGYRIPVRVQDSKVIPILPA